MQNFRLALAAENIKNSVSPFVYQYYADSLGFTINFEIFNISENELQDFIKYARDNLDGFSTTMPYKQIVLKYADKIDVSAKNSIASNVIQIRDKSLTAYNTDGWGFIKALSLKGIDVEGKKLLIIGAGGAASSIAYNLDINNAGHITVLNRSLLKAEKLCSSLKAAHTSDVLNSETLSKYCSSSDIIVNASSIGQVGFDDFLDISFMGYVKKDAVIFDVNYSNEDAKLLKEAKRRGITAINGKFMVVCQGIQAIEIWTGKRPEDRAAVELIEKI